MAPLGAMPMIALHFNIVCDRFEKFDAKTLSGNEQLLHRGKRTSLQFAHPAIPVDY